VIGLRTYRLFGVKGLGGLGWKDAREWEEGGNVMNVVSKLLYFYRREVDSTKGEWLRTCWLFLGVVSRDGRI
jgi:hypothetical protein